MRYGIPVSGTTAHSWSMSFPAEVEAFGSCSACAAMPAIQLIDTYDALEGARRAASLGKPLRAVRIR